MKSLKRRVAAHLAILGAPMMLGMSPAARAQAPAPSEQTGLAEIVVTAQKRSESLQDVPIAVTAIRGADLLAAGIGSQSSLATMMPNVAVDTNANFVAPYIRGVGTAYANPGLEPSVATYIDDIYVSRADAGFLSFDDIDHIEVLKGPQGTLYGRNTTGGAIRVITKEAPKEFSAGISLTAGSFGRFASSAFVGGPLGGNVRGRLSVQTDRDDGWVKNFNSDLPRLDNRNSKMVRGKLAWDVTDQLTMRLSADYSDMTPRNPAFLPLYPGIVNVGVALGGTISTDPRVYSGDYPRNNSDYQNFRYKQGGGEFRIDYALDAATFSSITGYRYVWFHGLADLDTTNVTLIQANTIRETTNDFSQEFQAVSNGDGRFKWVGGLFYFHESAGHNFGVGGVGVSGPLGIPDGFTGGDGDVSIESYAPYGQVTFKISPQWELLAGARYTKEKKTLNKNIFYITTVDGDFRPGANLVEIPAANTGAEVKPTAFSPKVGINWRPVDGVMAYFSFSKGFKSGGFNLPQPSPQDVQQVGNEYLEAYEVGLKSEFGPVRLNLAAFHYKGKDLQVQITDQNSGITSIRNAATSKTDGFEADLQWAVVKGLELDAGFGVQNGKFTSFPDGQAVRPGVVGTVTTIEDLTDKQIPNAPKVSGYLRPVYNVSLPGNAGSIEASAVVSYTGKFYWTADNVVPEDAKTLINANVNWTSADGHGGIGVFGTNLSDKVYFSHIAQFATGGWRVPGRPREFGIRGWLNF